jgi:hypothetical protein
MRVQPLAEGMVERYVAAWRQIEVSFLDTAGDAVTQADELVLRLFHDRGFQINKGMPSSFPSKLAGMVNAYAAARPLASLSARGQATMRERREAMARYRWLVTELLQAEPLANGSDP